MKKILLVSPDFHGYWQAVKGALETIGYDVIVHRYDFPHTFSDKVINKLLHELPEAPGKVFARMQTNNAIEVFTATKPDIVLVLKGDDLTEMWWDALESSHIPTAVWLYDEFANMKYDKDKLHKNVKWASYSNADASFLSSHGIPTLHVPDAYDSLLNFKPVQSAELSFVGARYPQREQILKDVQLMGIPVVAYGRDWSRYYWDVIRTGKYTASGVTSRRELNRSEYYGVMAGSLATLNLHGGHSGFNMRTFEAPGVGALQIIDRPDVDIYFDVGTELLVSSDPEEIAELYSRAKTDERWALNIRECGRRRALADHTMINRMKLMEQLWL